MPDVIPVTGPTAAEIRAETVVTLTEALAAAMQAAAAHQAQDVRWFDAGFPAGTASSPVAGDLGA